MARAHAGRRREAMATIARATTTPRDGDDGRSMWVDCDPGHDDAFALYLALHGTAERARVLVGASATHGNASAGKTTVNALRALAWIGAQASRDGGEEGLSLIHI